MYKIAIYGKGGIGKSTTASSVAFALAERGLKVMQIGCDPKADSTSNLLGGERIQSVLDVMRARDDDDIALTDLVHKGAGGVLCVEAGGPTPGSGCAGRGIITAFEKLAELEAYEVHKPDVVLYDVLGDVVCGGFAMPLRAQYADAVFVVTSGEKMSLYAAANIMLAVENFKGRNYAKMGGLVLNCRNVRDEERLVEELAQEAKTRVVGRIPRSDEVQRAEERGMTVVQAAPESAQAQAYRDLAGAMLHACDELAGAGGADR